MGDVIFARTRHNYQSYDDFWRVVELSGYPICYFDEIDWDEVRVVIATPKNGEWDGIPVEKETFLVWWNIERSRNEDSTNASDKPACVDEIWASDRAMALRHGFKYVFLGGHPALGSVDVQDKQYDIITLMAPLARRYTLLGELAQFKSADTGSLWGGERHRRLMASRLMIMAHQDDLPWCEPPRMMLGGCYAMPMLCEESADSGGWVNGEHYVGVPLADIVPTAKALLRDEVKLARLGAAAWQLCCVERTFRREVEAAL